MQLRIAMGGEVPVTEPLRPREIMLIDDNSVDNRVNARAIRRTGCMAPLRTFTMAEAALDHLRAPGVLPVDLIFLDINMPRMDGWEFIAAAEAEFGASFLDSAVVMLTTSTDPRDRQRAEKAGEVRGFLAKPLTPEVFTATLTCLGAGVPLPG